ncbi:NAD-dependent protein deacetylase [Aggregicoccus sp. 17bor-14]|uniref:NAD-dependent protein deacetylase n=1 Tax=Myxococcaceae TaxID=31 RepID=UPI00129CFD89|nr:MULTISPECIES: NAD-dependent protein deacetylase [Myxococcaceae]MBF5045089.1 NAD-dependent protein deacetylase [Simulacricoccus sp. 17bor-14]MRI90831.1 NAD-dependent protein deacetylase [Aggregicoccus sp. 17bor-14]
MTPATILPAEACDPAALQSLAELLRGRRVAVLTGAGCSTESGIPDYRGPASRGRLRTPIQDRDFLRKPEVRQRYWARSLLGWPRFCAAEPNAAHAALAQLEARGHVSGVITQNVDRLHQRAGSRQVIELHGALAEVLCLGCGALTPRDRMQQRLQALNPDFAQQLVEVRPDGDAELHEEAVASFRVPTCDVCGEGLLKPHVVFFGGFVPPPTVEAAYALVERSEALLVVGTSLAVYSGLRFVRRARERGLNVAVLNLGETRADALAHLRVEARLGEALPRLAEALG